MKLPVDGENSQGESPAAGEDQQTEAPQPGHEEGTVTESNGSNAENGSATSHHQEPDFSEYLWMEHEEEYDEQVLKELEDEEMINYYFELYEESVAEEQETRRRNPNVANCPPYNSNAAVPPGCVGVRPATSRIGGCPPGNHRQSDVDDITRGIDRVNFSSSRLNPDAAEFVPRSGSAGSTNPSDDNHCPPSDTQPC